MKQLERARIGGDLDIDLGTAAERFGLVEVDCRTTCASGDPIGGRWRGIELADLLAEIDAEATHLLVESADGFRACVPIVETLDGIIAVERLDTESVPEGLPRLIAPSLSGTRLVQNVAAIEGKQLSASADPEEFEQLLPDEDEE